MRYQKTDPLALFLSLLSMLRIDLFLCDKSPPIVRILGIWVLPDMMLGRRGELLIPGREVIGKDAELSY